MSGGTIRVARRRRFTTISRETINDDRLSYRARGVLAWLLDKPDDWTCDSNQIARQGKEGRDAVRAALRELEECGYLVRTKAQGDGGRWITETTIYERPIDPNAPPEPGNPASAGQASADPSSGNRAPDSQAVSRDGDNSKTVTKDGDRELSPSAVDTADPRVSALCDRLAAAVGGYHRGARPAVTKRWREDMRLLVERGPLGLERAMPIEPERIEKAIRVVFGPLAQVDGNGFCWAAQVRSPGALREHWVQLMDAARRQGERKRATGMDAVADYAQQRGLVPSP